MNSRDAIKIGLDTAQYVCNAYLSDLSDADLMHRPHPECNHINWQVGHLVLAEHEMIEKIAPGSMPSLPTDFAAKYSKETAGASDPKQFCTREVLMATAQAQRAGTLAVLAKTSDEQLDQATGVDYAPTLASMFSMQGAHWLMHCGQWVVVRRQLKKPVLI